MSYTLAGFRRREISVSFVFAAAFGLLLALVPGASANGQDATPTPSSCASVMSMSTPAGDVGAMQMSTPAAMDMGDMEMSEMMDIDLAYIDMMIPHHESIIALAQVALPELTDPRLIELSEAVIETQSREIETLTSHRDEWYPDAEPVEMGMMMEMLPGMESSMTSTPSMQELMSAEWLVTTFCAAEDKDLAFIELTIPHHQMAIDASEPVLEGAVHPELIEIAQDVIAAQQAEIDLLVEVEAELTGEATPDS